MEKKFNTVLFTSEHYHAHHDFWKTQFTGIEERYLLEDALQSNKGEKDADFETINVNLTQVHTQIVNDLVRSNPIGVFVVLMSGLTTLLDGYRRQELGLVLNTLPLKTSGKEHAYLLPVCPQISDKKTVKEVLGHLKEVISKSFQYQDYPLVLAQQTGTDFKALSNVLSYFDKIHEEPSQEQLSAHDLIIGFNQAEHSNSISVQLTYNKQIFSDFFVRNLAQHLSEIFGGFKDVTTEVKGLDWKSKVDLEARGQNFNSKGIGYPEDATIPSLFESMADSYPNKIALRFNDEVITYAELDQKSNQLAHVLRAKGVGPDRIVGLVADRSPRLIIGVLGILKAGGAYLPIDPNYPEDRIRFTLDDSKASVVVREKHLNIELNGDVEQVLLDEEEVFDNVSNERLGPISSPDNLAYIIYTSGSTGRPKGVMIEHKNATRLFFNDQNLFDFSERDVWTLFHSFAFDFSVWEIFGAILFGGELIIVPKETTQSPDLFRTLLEAHQVTILNQTPAAFNNLVQEELAIDQANLSLRYVIFGGEALVPALLEGWHKKYPSVKLINMYGITETTVHVTYKEISEVEIGLNQSNIGMPIPTLDVHILDSNLNYQPVGVVGEICITGLGVARGYLNRKELTNEKFVPNPFDKKGGSTNRMYRSGDLGMYLPSGEITYVGRMDRQVKIRGFRIELGEIEGALLNQTEIREALVMDATDQEGNLFLSAYLVWSGDEELSSSDLRERLEESLPNYMIPSFFTFLDTFPLTVNGKIDRKALPKPKEGLISDNYVEPKSQTEYKLAGLWQDVLALEQVGSADHFFNLGGHSMNAAILSGKIQSEFKIAFALRDVFSSSVLTDQASLIDERIASGAKQSLITKAEAQPYYPLSSAQKRMFVIEQFGNLGTTYNLPFFYELPEAMEVGRIEKIILQLIDRHESLRTYFDLIDGQPVQCIVSPDDINFSLTTTVCKQTALLSLQQKFVRPFTLSSAPLFRVELLEIADTNKRLLMLDMHHVISDGVSSTLFLEDFRALYKGTQLEPLAIQYKDFASWQFDQSESGQLKTQQSFWEKQFADEPILNLPTDFPRPSIMNFEGGAQYFYIKSDRGIQLTELAVKHNTSVFGILMAVYNVVLSKYSSQDDVVVGMPDAGRHMGGTDRIIGMFVNTLPIRNFPESDKLFSEFVKEVDENVLKAHENQDYPFEDLLDQLSLVRDTSRNPLYDVVLNYQRKEGTRNFDWENPERLNKFEGTTAKFDLTISALHAGDALGCRVEYRTSLFRSETIEQFINHFQHILDQVIEDSDVQLKDLELTTADEQQKILELQKEALSSFDAEATIHQFFEEQVRLNPEKIALVLEEERLTYQNLNDRANLVAAHLVETGLNSEAIVAVLLDRSIESVISMLGILKAGGAYMPVDPNFPQDRINYMLEDSGAQCVVSLSDYTELIVGDLSVVLLDQMRNEVDFEGIETRLPVVQANHLAYIIYTSGTTGNPKGVMIEHRNVVQLMKADQTNFSFNSDDVWTMFHSFTFDFSVWEMYGSLLYGGKLVIVPKRTAQNPSAFLELIKSEGVTVLNQTPTAFNNLIHEVVDTEREEIPSLRYVIFGGEALQPANLKPWNAKFPNVELINMFGITETTVHVTFKKITEAEIESNVSNIGVPIPTLRTHVMDENMRILPIGVPGELCVSGHGVARGYLNKPSITAERFVENPYVKGERLYKSGDLAKLLPNGEMEYLGRIDQQVKIRGHRIELGEIESQFLNHSTVKEIAVLALNLEGAGASLCAYYTGEAIEANDWRMYLAEWLPEYMIPSYFIHMHEMPLTLNGKLNRKALPDPRESILVEATFSAPETDEERMIATIWSEVLDVDVELISRDSNFFNLGGDSIKAIRIIAQLKARLEVQLGMAEVFKYTSLRALAHALYKEESVISENELDSAKAHLAKVKNEVLNGTDYKNVEDAYPMSDIQQGMLYYTLKTPELGIYHDQIIHYLKDETGFDLESLKLAVKKVTDKHEILRASFSFDEFSEPVQVVHQGLYASLEWEDLRGIESAKQEKAIRSYLKDDLAQPFEIKIGKVLWHLQLFQLTDAHICAAFVCHHAIIDGWSDASMMTEIASSYFSLKDGKEIILEPLKSSYKDYVLEQQAIKSSIAVQDWWKKELKLHQPLELPIHDAAATDRIILSQSLNSDQAQGIKHLAEQFNTDLRTIHFAAFSYAMNSVAYQSRFTLGVVENGRPAIEDGDKILGCFLNTVPVMVQISKNQTWKNLIERTSSKLQDLKTYGRLPLIEIAQLAGVNSSVTNPLFDVFFNFVDFHVYDDVEVKAAQKEDITERTVSVGGNIKTNTSFNFTINYTGKTPTATLDYSNRYLSRESGAVLLKLFKAILDQMIKDSEATMTVPDLVQLESKSSERTSDQELNSMLVPELIEAHLISNELETAILVNKKQYSKAELSKRSNQIAQVINNRQLGRGDVIAVVMDRSFEMIATLLGILKSGAAYLPIDPTYPKDRIEYMLADSKSNLILTDGTSFIFDESSNELPELIQIGELDLNTENSKYICSNESSDLAYVIYTSGSTGKPKGVAISHGNMTSFVQWANKEFQHTDFETVFASTSYSFDLSIFELFYTLQSGKQLRLLQSGLEIKKYLNVDQNILINTVPSVIQELQELEVDWSNVNAINMAGEPIPIPVKKALDYSRIEVRNLYGPSEDTTYSTFVHFKEFTEVNTIGQPIDHTQAFILDENQQVVLAGTAGELCLAGAGVAMGYLHKPELTSERFLENPFGKGRLYRTGDLARWRTDGDLEYMGRLDDQVKIRGFRIELGEIEARITALSSVQEVVVLDVQSASEEKILCAYLVLSESGSISEEEVQQELKLHLPAYMIPSSFVFLEEFPRTPNGKTDRKALRSIEGKFTSTVQYVVPETETEIKLAAIWSGILRVPEIGKTHNFFELGGHSLKATVLISKIQKELKADLSLAKLFELNNLEEMAAFIDGAEEFAYQNIVSVADQESYPLSPAQRRMYILNQFEGVETTYNLPYIATIKGALNIESFEKAFQHVIERHEALRTRFAMIDDALRTQVLPASEVEFSLDVDEKTKVEADEIASKFVKRFDLGEAPLIRARIIKISGAKDQHLFMLDVHHIIADGVSLRILMDDFIKVYEGKLLDPLALQYKDYAVWQETFLESDAQIQQKNYWLKQFEGEIPILNFPADYPRPSIKRFDGANLNFHIDLLTSEKLEAIAKKNDTTLFVVVLALYNVVLSKYTGQEDLVIGSALAGRNHPDLHGIVGMFVNMLALRNKPTSEQGFEEFVSAVRQSTMDALANQDLQYDDLVEWLDVPREIGRNPLFDTSITWQNLDEGDEVMRSLTFQSSAISNPISKFDFNIEASRASDGIRGTLTYSTTIYKEHTFVQFLKHFEEIAAQVASNPVLKLSEIQLLSENDPSLDYFINEINATETSYDRNSTLHSHIEAHAQESPEAIAVNLGSDSISYQALNEKSNQLAHHLINNVEVEANDPIGVVLDSSIEMIVAIVGILKSGGCYVPIDPNYPEQRIRYMIEDISSKVLITHSERMFDLIEYNIPLFTVDLELDGLEESRTNPSIVSKGTDLAYIIYTSGSTGKPKGVMVNHSTVARLLVDSTYISLKPSDVVLQTANYAFDGSVFNIFGPLLNGARLALIAKNDLLDLSRLMKVIQEESISILFLPTALLNAIIDTEIEVLKGIRKISFGGDKASFTHIEKALEVVGPNVLINLYGPTEGGAYATYHPVNILSDDLKTIPIGKPIDNTTVYILNELNQLQPTGIAGEICIGGDAVANGYLNKLELTTAVFVDNPFVENQKMYRSGDLGRWLPDGTIEFLGRKDYQVKIRGFRIELGEIENALLSSDQIKEAVVVDRIDHDGSKYLSGYVVQEEDSGRDLDLTDLKGQLSKKIPDYMVPAFITLLDQIPLTAHGKVDSKALPDPEKQAREEAVFVEPEGEIETQLASYWMEILGLEKVSALDNFFDIGGQSLKATRIISRIGKDLQAEVGMSDVFSHPTIRELAQIIETRTKNSFAHIQSLGKQDYYELSHAQRRLWVINQLNPESQAYNMPIALKIQGALRVDSFIRSLKAMVRRHEVLRTTFVIVDGTPMQHIAPVDSEFVVQFKDFSEEKDGKQKAEEWIAQECSSIFDLENGPLFKAGLAQTEPDELLFFGNMHHIISDGWSMQVLFKETMQLYRSYSKDLDSPLNEIRIQYKDFAAWQNAILDSEEVDNHKSYWHDKLSGTLEVVQFPSDFKRPEVRTQNGAEHRMQFDPEVSEMLRELSKEHNVSMFILMQACTKVLLQMYTGQSDIIVGTSVAGRSHADLETQIGFYVNALVLRDQFELEETFLDVLEKVKKTTIEAFDHQQYPYDRLVDELEVDRDLSRNPIYDIMITMSDMNMDDNRDLQDAVGEIQFTPFGSGSVSSKFDLTFSFSDQGTSVGLTIVYNTDLFLPERIQQIEKHFNTLIPQLIIGLEMPLSLWEISTSDVMEEIVADLTCGDLKENEEERNIQSIFEKQVRLHGIKKAVICGEESVTYKELNEKANRLANLLIGEEIEGVEQEEVVGLVMDRSIDMLVGILGILKAGKAFLPIDPEIPIERRTFLLQDSGSSCIVSKSHLLTEQESKSAKFKVILLDEQEAFLEESILNPNLDIADSRLAYVIYTSGSTGEPKGVAVEHCNLMNYISWFTQEIDLKAEDQTILLHSFGFDGSFTNIFGALLNGNTFHITSTDLMLDAVGMLNYIDANQISYIKVTPSYLSSIVQHDAFNLNGLSACLRFIMIGGEEIRLDDVKQIIDQNPSIQLMNHYGPTETTIGSIYHFIDNTTFDQYQLNPVIGKPLANTQLLILRENETIQPKGVVGELCIAGKGVARGYLGKTGMTNLRFVDHPFVEGKLYKTGDLAVLNFDGNIEFKGRIDAQIKVRGYRVEPGEIQECIKAFEGIASCIVHLISTDVIGAYFTKNNIDDAIDLVELKQHVRNQLPAYMVPAHFMELDEIPLTTNGKTDFKALPDPRKIDETLDFVEAKTATELELDQIWKEILKMEKIHVHADFFEMGGHSLSAAKMAALIHKKIGKTVSLRSIFKFPTIHQLGKFVDQQSANEFHSIQSIEEQEYYDLSPAQKRVYVLNRFGTGQTQYNMPMVLQLEGETDLTQLRASFQQLINRHESLRTEFHLIEGFPKQKVIREIPFELNIVSVTEETLNTHLKKLVQPFDLSKAPLLRVNLYQVNAKKHVLALDMHHIITDGVSMGLLSKEFLRLYHNEKLEPLRLQYKDFADWQNKRFEGKEIQNQEAFWLDQFKGELPILNVPIDFPRPQIQRFSGASIRTFIDQELTDQIRVLSLKLEATPYMVLLSAYSILLSKYSNQQDVIIGTPIAGRPHADLQDIIGMFVNTLALRNYPSHGKTGNEYIKEVSENTLEALDNQDFPFEELIEKLDIPRDASRNPLFDAMFSFQTKEKASSSEEKERSQGSKPGLQAKLNPIENETTKFDLMLDAAEFQAGIALTFFYSTSLYSAPTMEAFKASFVLVLKQLVESPEIDLKDISLLKESDKSLFQEVNNTKLALTDSPNLVASFEEQVRLNADQTAVQFESTKLSYQELDARSNAVAGMLVEKGVQLEDRVALHLERNEWMIVGILAILKAGAAYVPIDPSFPEKRKSFMLEDSGAKLLLYQGENLRPEVSDGLLFDITNLAKQQSNLSFESIAIASSNLAYVIYTSGSTGNPKGVLVEHGNVLNLVAGLKEAVYSEVPTNSNIALIASYIFDASVQQIFGALLQGHALHIVGTERKENPASLVQYYTDENIHLTDGTPSFLHLISSDIVDYPKDYNVQKYIIGGEALSSAVIKQLFQKSSNTKAGIPKVTNIYGPTECCVDSTLFQISVEEGDVVDKTIQSASVSIGRPMVNQQVFILNENGKQQPIGVLGELYIAGKNVSRGYLNLPELTKEKFVQIPELSDERMYKTGDLARWNHSGNLEFLGRMDFQVKIRGFRIELGDIESALASNENVVQSAVVDWEDDQGNAYLCAYVVTKDSMDSEAISNRLTSELPDYMIPSVFVELEEIPLNQSGKVNRKRLPMPDFKEASKDFESASTIMEELLLKYWQQVLGTISIGVNDGFFASGGDSIKAIQLSALLLKEQLKLELSQLYQYQTIRKLAPHIKRTILNIPQEPATGEVPLTPIQRRFFEQNHRVPHHFNQSIMLKSDQPLDGGLLNTVFSKLIEHHDALRLVFVNKDEGILQKYRSIEEFELEEIKCNDFASLHPEKAILAMQAHADEAQSQFELFGGSLFKVVWYRMDRRDYLLMVAHHLLIDAVSWRIILEDIKDVFGQMSKGEAIEFQAKTHSFKRWSEGLNDFATSPELKKEIPFWTKSVEGIEPKLPGRKEGEHAKPIVVKQTFALNEQETSEVLKGIAHAPGIEINDVLLSAFGMGIKHQWPKYESISIMLEGHGREHISDQIEISRTVGWFTSMFPIRIESTRGDSMENLRFNRNFLHSIPQKGIGYGVLKYLTIASLETDLPKHEQPGILFNYLGQIGQGSKAKEDSNQKTGRTGIGISGLYGGAAIAPENRSEFEWNVSLIVVNNRLQASISFDSNRYETKEMNSMIQHFRTALMDLSEKCLDEGSTSDQNIPTEDGLMTGLETIITNPVFELNVTDASKDACLFLFPPAIGFSLVYQDLASNLSVHDIYGVNFLEDENRMQIYVDKIRAISNGRRIVFAGHSGGGNLAYHVVLEAEKQGLKISDIIMLDGARELVAHSMTEERIKENVHRFVSEEEGHSSHQLLKTKKERDRVRAIVEKYQQHISLSMDQESVEANIHMIRSTQEWEEGNKRKELWAEVTNGTFVQYQGKGDHQDMLNSVNIRSNSDLIEAILLKT